MARQKLPLEQIAAITEMRSAGWKLEAIAEELNIAVSTAFCYSQGWKNTYEYATKRKRMAQSEKEHKDKIRDEIYAEVLEFINGIKRAGLSQNQIAKRIGISRQLMSRYSLEKGLPSEERYKRLKNLYEELCQPSENASTL